jgi:hypothetical protein
MMMKRSPQYYVIIEPVTQGELTDWLQWIGKYFPGAPVFDGQSNSKWILLNGQWMQILPPRDHPLEIMKRIEANKLFSKGILEGKTFGEAAKEAEKV